ncbi:sodium:alanine symporter family protein [Bacillus wiedmannii]|uniref:alanine/glycine:cation symporter family protein n=1 Tax=Bacillus wiedmannii TaxID=1890302 RepID=UPI000BF8ECB4|nr:sodium:alanine symporter family protein [Bacillus wiedmannii]PEQ02774.1 sodium:alanine symporter family protein [Bacillus wiedmannii]
METVSTVLEQINHYVWGLPTLLLLVGTGIILTVRLKGLQFSKLLYAHKLAFKKSEDTSSSGDISHFQALMTAMAATIGMGNIAGVATAVTIGGPMYYLERGLGKKWLAVLFAIFGTTASFGIGNMVQSNSVAEAMRINFSFPPALTGIFMSFLIAIVILGGVKKIGKVTGYIVPIKAFFYIIAGLIIIFYHYDQIPEAFSLIFSGAFNGTAAAGGFIGATIASAIQIGMARGVFANEAGLGSAPIAAAAAKTDSPAKQALVSMTGTFLDTFIVCTITGLVLITTGAWKSGKTGVEATTLAFQSVFGTAGSMILGIAIILFAYSTILGWSYYGEKCVAYLFGEGAVKYYKAIFIVMIAIGANLKLGIVWTFADIANGLMAIPNLIGLIGLSGIVVAETNRFLQEEKLKESHKKQAS